MLIDIGLGTSVYSGNAQHLVLGLVRGVGAGGGEGAARKLKSLDLASLQFGETCSGVLSNDVFKK